MSTDPTSLVTLDTGARDYADPTVSALFVYGANLGLPLVGMTVLLVSAARLLRRVSLAKRSERQAKETAATPVAGDAVIHGTVTGVEGDARVAVRLTVEQLGVSVKTNKTSWTTKWREVERRVETHPFFVRTDAGNELRVEPDDRVVLVDDLETRPPVGNRREKVAELTVGEEIYALGVLTEVADPRAGAGYRGGGASFVLRPPSSERPMEISTRPLRERYAQAAGARVVAVLALLLLTVVVQLLATPYHLAGLFGFDAVGVVLSRRQQHSDDEHYHRVTVGLPESDVREDIDVETHEDYDRLAPGARVAVHVTTVGGSTRLTLDAGPRANKAVVYIPVVAIVLALVGCVVLLGRSRPWYEREALNDEEDGKLSTSGS